MKVILGVLIATLFLSAAFAQEIKFGDPAVQELQIKISENGNVHVTHEIEKSRNTQQVEFLSSEFTNFTIIDDEGGEPEYAEAGGAKPGIVLFPTKEDIILEYDVEGMVKKKDGLWTWNYVYLADSSFYLPDNVRLFYVNGNLVDLKDQEGFRCHGCQVMLEYELSPTIITKQIQWEDKKFDVKILTLTEISSFELAQPKKTISFEVSESNKYVTLVIPRELLWNPYEVLLNGEPLPKQEQMGAENKVWLHIKPNETGKVEIVGISVVPEFPLAVILVLSAAMVVAIYANRINLR
ncbi:MAG: hypothetical protein ACT4OD_00635 [Candidatus Nitrosotenuis sp.]